MNKKQRWVLIAVIVGFCVGWGMMFVAQTYGGEYVTYTDPKTGLRYYGDAVPPSAPSNVRVEVRKHEPVSSVGGNWTAPKSNVISKPKSSTTMTTTTTKEMPELRMDPIYEHLTHQFNQPLPPTRGRTAAEFNARTGAHEKYASEMLDWRMKGHDIGYKYTPTGFSEGERMRYDSVGSFDRAFRKR